MESAKYNLARESAGFGIDPSTLIYLFDLMVAIELVMTTAAGLAKEHVTKWIKLLRLSVPAICAALGDHITPANLRVQDLIDSRAKIKESLRKAHSSTEATRHSNHLRLLLAYARGMGIKHKLFDVEQDWEQIPFFGKDRAAQMVITSLIDNLVRPWETTQEHLNDWYVERRNEHYSIASTNQAIAYLKMRIRETEGWETLFPLLDPRSEQLDPCRMALKKMNLTLRAEVEEALSSLAEEIAPGITRIGERTRQNFLMLFEILCGFADLVPHVGTIEHLSDCLNRSVITAHFRWLHYTGRANQTTIKARIYILHAFLTQYPPFASQDWSWMCSKRLSNPQGDVAGTLVAEFPEEPESKIDARRQARAFNFNYTAVADLLVKMQERGESEFGRSELEIGWMLHDESLMQWLEGYPLPPRCMYECRIKGTRPNLFKASECPDLVPESLKRTKIPHLVSDDMWVLFIEADQVPNRKPIICPLPDQLVPGLVRFLEYRQQLIKGEDPGTLWLNRDGGALKATTFCKLVRNISESYLHYPIPPGAFRYIAAYRFLSWKPDDYKTLASLLSISEHSAKMRYDPKYRQEHRSKPHPAGYAA